MSDPPRSLYLAATYARRLDLADKARQLESIGISVTSRWLDGSHGKDYDSITADQRASAAAEDVEDVAAADGFVIFADGRGRGGKHVEFGMALALGKRLFLVGEPEHVFHWLPAVSQFREWDGFLATLTPAERGS